MPTKEPTVTDRAFALSRVRKLACNILYDYNDGEPIPPHVSVELAELCDDLGLGTHDPIAGVVIEPDSVDIFDPDTGLDIIKWESLDRQTVDIALAIRTFYAKGPKEIKCNR